MAEHDTACVFLVARCPTYRSLAFSLVSEVAVDFFLSISQSTAVSPNDASESIIVDDGQCRFFVLSNFEVYPWCVDHRDQRYLRCRRLFAEGRIVYSLEKVHLSQIFELYLLTARFKINTTVERKLIIQVKDYSGENQLHSLASSRFTEVQRRAYASVDHRMWPLMAVSLERLDQDRILQSEASYERVRADACPLRPSERLTTV
jgi:hypothetical protein